jgi:uncharacterized protein YdhG (YjbR/CyaY superfamily)
MTSKPASVEEYLASFAGDRRARLEDLRRTVRATAPDAVEQIGYDMPLYKLDGRMLVSFAAFAKHDSVFPASQVVVDALGEEVAPFVRGRGTFQFRADAPLPLDLIARIVAIRVDEVAHERS